jgi:integrase
LASLRPESFALDDALPTATVAAAYAKNGKTAAQPLPQELADALRRYLAGKPHGQPVWPGTWYTKAFEMMRADLEAAGIAYRDAAGRRADFHCLRYTFITNLVRGGANPKVAQVLARHSTVQLTLGRYAHAALYDQAAAVEALPRMLSADSDHVLAPTGTDGRA